MLQPRGQTTTHQFPSIDRADGVDLFPVVDNDSAPRSPSFDEHGRHHLGRVRTSRCHRQASSVDDDRDSGIGKYSDQLDHK